MLRKLFVQNYALIDELHLHLGKGLNIITGETGAGKSVLMGALGLLLGERADSSALLDTSKKCIIQGEFYANPKVRIFLESADLDAEEDLIIHREISKDGKSRSFINDTPVNLSVLRELGDLLVDIHSQHETLLLNKSDFQLSIVDAFANHQPLLSELKAVYSSFIERKAQLKKLEEEELKSRADQDYLQFQFNELTEAGLVSGELVKLEDELSTLTHASEIISCIENFSDSVNRSEINLLGSVSELINQLAAVSKFSPGITKSLDRLKNIRIELKDIDYEILQEGAKISVNPQRLEVVNDRINLLNKLLQKHRIQNDQGLIELRNTLDAKLASFSSLGEMIARIKTEVDLLFKEIKKYSEKISANRKKSIPGIESKIKKLLAELSMPEAVLKIEVTDRGDLGINESGRDQIKFLFSANKGIPYSDISKVASGGELSRLMLSLKACVASLMELPTIVFDEIDTGVSGETAFKIGKVMQDLSHSHQLLAITHLPQIASRGEDHFFVYKEVTGKKTYTKVRKLPYDERIVEVARMLSGDKPTAVAMENAKELLKY